MDAYLSTRSVLWLDPSDEFSVLKNSSNHVHAAYNKSSNSLLKNFKTTGPSSGVIVKSYTNSRGRDLQYLSFNGLSVLESQWDYSYDNNTVYLVFKVNQVTSKFQGLISHHKDWEYRAELNANFMGALRYKPLNAYPGSWALYKHDKMYSNQSFPRSGNINVGQGWHLLAITFRGGTISISVDGETEEFLPTQFNNKLVRQPNNPTRIPVTDLKSTLTTDYYPNIAYPYEANVFHNSRRFIRTNRSTQLANFEPSISNSTYWFPSKLNICSNHNQAQKLKADIAEMICIPTTDINPVANYLIKKWDIERA